MRKRILAMLIATVMAIGILPTVTITASAVYKDFYDSGITNTKLAQMVADGTIPQNVTDLDLGYNLISNITPLASLTNLEYLYLDENQITNVTPLFNLKKLKYLDLSFNPLSQEQINALKAALPDCDVDFYTYDPCEKCGKEEANLCWACEVCRTCNEKSKNRHCPKCNYCEKCNYEYAEIPHCVKCSMCEWCAKDRGWDWCYACNHCDECCVCGGAGFKLGRIISKPSDNVKVGDAIEILKYLAKMKNAITDGGEDSPAWNASLIIPASQKAGKPTVSDAIEILKKLAKMKSLVPN